MLRTRSVAFLEDKTKANTQYKKIMKIDDVLPWKEFLKLVILSNL